MGTEIAEGAAAGELVDVSPCDRERLVEELVEANRRLSGTLRIVLDTLDHTDVDELFSQVIEELADTLGASGAILYLSEPDGLRLHGATESLDGARIPPFVPREVDFLGMGSGRSLGLHLVAIDKDELREGPVSSRLVENDATGERRRVPARYLPPFSSLVMVPVWFGRHVIAVILVGWQRPHALRKADGELLDAVAQYLSIQLMGAVTTLRNERAARNDRVVRICVIASFAASYAASHFIPLTMAWSSGTRIIALTVVISAIAALVHPVDTEWDDAS